MLVTIDGSEPSRNLIPAYACPACGVPYISVPVPVALQERIERALFRAEHEVKN